MRPLIRITLVSWWNSPSGAYRLDALAGDNLGIETLQIDTARHHLDLVPSGAVTIIDELRDLLARRNNPIAARHDPVVETLEKILFAEAFVPTGHELGAVQTRGNRSTPCAGAAECMNHLATPLSGNPTQNDCIS